MHQIYRSTVPVNYRKASESCLKMEMRMASPEIIEHLMKTSIKEKEHTREERWQPILKETYNNWTMDNGTIFGKTLSKMGLKINKFRGSIYETF